MTFVRVVGQPVDHDLPARKLERLNRQLQAIIQAIDNPVQTTTKIPADRWHQQSVENANGGKNPA